MSEHGTTSRYTQGCRCARCRAANAEYQRAYQARRKAKTTRIAPTPSEIAYAAINRFTASISAMSTTQPQSFTLDTRQPLERTLDALVAACVDLREAFAAYHQALTQEPA